MDWAPVTKAVIADHDERCPDTGKHGHDWLYCLVTTPMPEMARRMGLLADTTTIADREAALAAPVERPHPDEWYYARCVCGHVRRGHSVNGQRCFHSPCTCTFEGGFRPAEEEQ